MLVGDRIKKHRLELKWTQDVLAKKAGISKTFLSELENGKRGIGAETLLKLGRVLGCSLDYLMNGTISETYSNGWQIPPPLVSFALENSLTVNQVVILFAMRETLQKYRPSKKLGVEKVDWQMFYEAVKGFLGE